MGGQRANGGHGTEGGGGGLGQRPGQPEGEGVISEKAQDSNGVGQATGLRVSGWERSQLETKGPQVKPWLR